MRKTRIILADHQANLRSALRLLLEQSPANEVVAEAEDGEGLKDSLRTFQADLLLMDWRLPGQKDGDMLMALSEEYPQLTIVIMSGRPENAEQALMAGADAFVSKCDPPERIISTMAELGY